MMFESGTLFFIQLVENRVGSNQIPAAFFIIIIIHNRISPPRFSPTSASRRDETSPRLSRMGCPNQLIPRRNRRSNAAPLRPSPSFLPSFLPRPLPAPARSLSFNCRKERAKASHPTVRPTHYGRDGAGADRIFHRRGPFNYCIQDLEIIVFYSPIPILPLTQAMSDCGR